jgi:diguanylate cyclase (GGDEF)-like protein
VGDDLAVVLLAAATFYIVNTVLVGIAVALHQQVPIRRYFRRDLAFVVVTGSVMLFLVPIVIAASAYSVVLIPLFLAPMVAIHNVVWRGSRSEFASRHDGLTGLPNRLAFHDGVQAAIDADPPDACVLLLDLDRFKEVNDTLGHRYGDLLLRQVAERFQAQLQDRDQIARLGGDEFAIFGHGYDREAAQALAARLTDSLRTPFELEQIVVEAQTSIGVALFPADGSDVETLLQKADVAMYQAKQSHTDMATYDERRDNHSPAKLALTADLRSALEGDGIVAWYQPQLDLRTGKVLAFEALVRWEHPHLGLLAPATFLDIAEHTSLIKPLTQRVLELALMQVADWQMMDVDLAVAVNVSARVLTDRDFTSSVMAALESAGVSPSRLKLEITESTLMADPLTARVALQELSRLGVEISIDDFGTGYSSLAYLADLPVSEVKIDRSFVSRMTEGSRETIIVSSTIDLAHHLGYRAIAEGVEDSARLSELQARGCDAAQGFVISPPLTKDDANRWLSVSGYEPRIDQVKLRSVA